MDNYQLRTKIAKEIANVQDPELFISIVDLGLIYNILVNEKKVTIEMTLTSFGCPLFPMIQKDIETHAQQAVPDKIIDIKLIFDPLWSYAMISESGKAELGID